MRMQGTVAVTDPDWYRHLLRLAPGEVNFWKPSPRRPFKAPQFSPLFFKLKAPHNAIGGFGYFVKWSTLPDWLAWEIYGEANGVASLEELRARMGAIRSRIHYQGDGELQNIGCILLVQSVFFPPDAWVRQPSDWRQRTVSSKAYDLTVGEGARIWNECLERAASLGAADARSRSVLVAEPTSPRYGDPTEIRPRLGQKTFRVAVLDAYGRECAATGEHSVPALEAAHIREYAREGPHEVRNGILLRADLHRLFDKGYVTVTPELRLEVSERLRKDFHNGRAYYPLHGTRLTVPGDAAMRPAEEYVRWHNENVYLG